MSTTSSSSPGNNETSNSSSQDLGADEESINLQTSPLSSEKPLPTASSHQNGRGIQKIPSKAESIYVWFLNRARWGERMLPDPLVKPSIDPEVPVKWAVLSVMSTKCPLSVRAIQTLLVELSYPCDRHSIRRALLRCMKFGLAVSERYHKNEHGILEGRRPHRHHKWKMTSRGQQLLNAPRINMTRETTTNLLQKALDPAFRWMSAAELAVEIGRSVSTVRRRLRSDPAVFKSEKIVGDRHGQHQWALASADTTGWANAQPPAAFSGQIQGTVTGRISCKTPNLSAPPRSKQPATYQGMNLMCSPTDKPSLIKAVGDLLVNEFVTAGKKFSAYDVTKRLRAIELDRAKNASRNTPLPYSFKTTPVDRAETGDTFVSGYKVPKIEHEDVRNIVHDIYNAGGMPNLGRIQVSNYWEYDTKANIDALVAASQPQSAPQPVTLNPSITSSLDPDPADGVSGSSYDGSSTV